MTNAINKHLRLDFSYTQHKFLPSNDYLLHLYKNFFVIHMLEKLKSPTWMFCLIRFKKSCFLTSNALFDTSLNVLKRRPSFFCIEQFFFLIVVATNSFNFIMQYTSNFQYFQLSNGPSDRESRRKSLVMW